MLELIQDLAKRIEDKWAAVDNSVYEFPDVVLNELNAASLVEQFKFTDINALLAKYELQNVQISSEFSELHVKLYDNGKFYIEILNWWNNDTSIHDHGFSGVLVQLSGSALNALYSFAPGQVISQNLKLGQIQLEDAFISKRGDVRAIPCGRVEKHAVFHLEQPTTSLIIRTHPVSEVSPQLNYFPPNVLVDHSATGLIFNKRLKYFRMLSKIDPKTFREQVEVFLEESSPTNAFWLLLKLSNLLFTKPHIDLLSRYSERSATAEIKNLRDKIIASVCSRYSSQYLIDKIKPSFSNPDDRLAISCLAAAYTQESFSLLAIKMGLPTNREETVSRIRIQVAREYLDQYDFACRVLSA